MPITRRHILSLLPALLGLSTAGAARATTRRHPNIVLIVADDLGYGQLSCYGQRRFQTPQIDRMAREGVLFSDFYTGSPVCASARCSLLTGKHMGHASIRRNEPIVRPPNRVSLKSDETTIPELLKQVGYQTGMVGKWGVGDEGTVNTPTKRGFDYFFGFLDQVNAHQYYPTAIWENEILLEISRNQDKQDVYSHDLCTEKALDFIRNSQDGPFFLYLAYQIPHSEYVVPEESMREYRGRFPSVLHERPGLTRQPDTLAAIAGMISRLDRDVGRIRQQISAQGQDQDTLILFTSDNGAPKAALSGNNFLKSNGPFRGKKGELTEGGIRVPLVATWKGQISPGRKVSDPAAFWDLLPTFCHLAGTVWPNDLDGISLADLLLNDTAYLPERMLYWEYLQSTTVQAVRTGKWKAIRSAPDLPIRLYDLDDDPRELIDVSKDASLVYEKIERFLESDVRTDSVQWPYRDTNFWTELDRLKRWITSQL